MGTLTQNRLSVHYAWFSHDGSHVCAKLVGEVNAVVIAIATYSRLPLSSVPYKQGSRPLVEYTKSVSLLPRVCWLN